jgi:uncharacterized protein (TIGR02147 family)
MDIQTVERIYEYDNYRRFLKDYFKEQKECRACFSYRYFAQRAGFASSSFCAHVIEGKRNLTSDSIRKMIKGLKLSGKAAQYFEALVSFNQSHTVEDREHWFRALERLRKSSQFYKVNQKQYAYYDEWYYPVIRELAVYSDWNGDYAKLGKTVSPPIGPEMARKAVETLLQIGLLVKNGNVFYQSSEAVTGEGVPGVVTRKTRKEYMLMAMTAAENLPANERHISGVTVAMSEEGYRQATEMIDEMRKKILENALDNPLVEKIYQFNFQAFPLSSKIPPSKNPPTQQGGEGV